MTITRPHAGPRPKLTFTPTPFDFEEPPADPIPAFMKWFEDALQLPVPNPNAMCLATVDSTGTPSARIVLLRGFDERGAVFFTNRHSKKGEAIESNRRVALLFHWDLLERQVRIEGHASHTSDTESDEYWESRPRESRLGSWASEQSRPVENRAELARRIREADEIFRDKPVPRPPHWGGYRVAIDAIEFWQGDPHRVHDRVRYQCTPGLGGWVARRLCP
ncbi:MAG: pyridoxamine 5'-phosphate oxidase [Phycisphaeraceae bacterium]|nr:pyridoxamine 5'-phosphate oxidase [Phycisphaeraceae bacterium]